MIISEEVLTNTNKTRRADTTKRKVLLDGPTLSSEDVARELGVSKQWVLQLAKRSAQTHPDNFLPGYVKKKDGEGWERKVGASNSRQEVFFYRLDVDRYKREHPEIEEDELDFSHVVVEPELRALIMEAAKTELDECGFVTRTRVRDILMHEYGYTDRVYVKIQKVAQDEQWALPKQQPKRTAKRRRGKSKKKAG